jgi:serine/threonine protein kinase
MHTPCQVMTVEDRYRLESKIGEGAQSVVFLGRCRQSGMAVAVKQIKPTIATSLPRDRTIPISKLAANYREVAVLQRLRSNGMSHPNIVDLLEVIFDQESVYIVMDHCGMNLSEYIARCRSSALDSLLGLSARLSKLGAPVVPIQMIRDIFAQTLSAVAFVHSQLVIHRDLKPQNIFVNFINERIIVKIGDFGLSKAVSFPIAPETLNVASLWYRAPEVLLQSGYDVGIDLWSLGCILAELAQGAPLFLESSEFGLLMKIFQTLGTPTKSGWRVLSHSPNASRLWPQWNRHECLPRFAAFMNVLLGSPGCDMLLKLLTYETNERIRCRDALAHPFLQPSFETLHDSSHVVNLSDRLSSLNV